MVLGGHLPHLAPLPVTEEDLTEVGLDDRGHPETFGQGGCGLLGPGQGGDVDGPDRLGGQPAADQVGLVVAEFGQPGVAVPVDEWEGVPGPVGLGLAMTDQQDLGCARGRFVEVLGVGRAEGLGVRLLGGAVAREWIVVGTGRHPTTLDPGHR